MKNDTISRAAAIDALNGLTDIFLNNLPPTIYKSDAVDAIKALPSAQPECEDAVPWEQLKRYAEWFCAQVSYPEFVREAKAFCESTIAAMKGGNIAPSVTPKQPGWIPCKTRKPEKSGLYLVTKQQKTGEIQLATAHYNIAFDEWSGNGNFKKVLAWQPLPSPWRGDT